MRQIADIICISDEENILTTLILGKDVIQDEVSGKLATVGTFAYVTFAIECFQLTLTLVELTRVTLFECDSSMRLIHFDGEGVANALHSDVLSN